MSDTIDKNAIENDPWSHEKGLKKVAETEAGSAQSGTDPASKNGGGKTLTAPKNLYEFIRQFYEAKAPLSKEYRAFFKNLDDKLSGEEQNELYTLASENDAEFGKTLTLAEFVLETPGKKNHRDKMMGFVQRVSSNAGSLSMTDSNTVFQQWLDDNSPASDKLSIFANNIDRLTDGKDKKGNDKKLQQKPRNNLGCISAMWLYYKDEATLPQLINQLMKGGFNLSGEAGPLVEARAFAFVASMIKSTKKKKFAYFVDYVGRHESALTEQIRQAGERNTDFLRRIEALVAEQHELSAALEGEQEKSTASEQKISDLQEKLALLEQERSHDSVHHGAAIQSADSQYITVLKELLDTLALARTALERGPDKAHILEYQLEEMESILRKELK